ncbi:hypothetical protein ADL22_09960 [Streptomyces sp. NRRL F-4489]|nr:hypothetical protein ADL22_09960 [Streptomyces sp. NRRL F-4489]
MVAAAAATAAVAFAGAPAATAAPLPLPSRHAPGESAEAFGPSGPSGTSGTSGAFGGPRRGDHLTITVTESGSARTDGRFELYCHPRGGNHFDARRACDRLDRMTRWGKDPFAPVPQGAQCTMMYGGPARAHVTGVWAGRPVNAEFRRTNGCEIARWGRFEPMLPATVS